MKNFFRLIATAVLYLIIVIVTLFSENAAQAWFPAKDELSGISSRSVVIIDLVLLIIIVTIVYFFVHAFAAK